MRIVGHLDMDAFFAAVEERDRPRLRGAPIVVGADPEDGRGRGVVSTANYAARNYGIHSAMPISEAWRRSEKARGEGKPAAVFIEPNFKKYSAESGRVMEILRRFTPLVEQASVDEAYFELRVGSSGFGVRRDEWENAREGAGRIKAAIRRALKLSASIGLGPNKLIAKIASDRQKPDGLTMVRAEDAEKFLEPLPVRVIPGVGPKTEEMFKRMNVLNVGDAKRFAREELQQLMGQWGLDLYEKLRGRDNSPLVEEHETKSIGEQETFARDTRDPSFLAERLNALCNDVCRRFSRSEFRSFKTVVLTVRFSDFETRTRSRTLSAPVPASRARERIRHYALQLLLPFLDARENPRRKKIRLIGVRIEKLTIEGDRTS